MRRVLAVFARGVELLIAAALVLFCAVIGVLAAARLVLAGHWLAAGIPAAFVGALGFGLWLGRGRSGRAWRWVAVGDTSDVRGGEEGEESEPPDW